jgi:hypothetical protein
MLDRKQALDVRCQAADQAGHDHTAIGSIPVKSKQHCRIPISSAAR